jgi:hypothetical protein
VRHWVANTPLRTLQDTSTLRLAEKKIPDPGSTGNVSKTMWLGRLSTFPNFENIFGKIKIFFETFYAKPAHLLGAFSKAQVHMPF